MSNIHRTSQGKEIDVGKLVLKNEEVRAVGNMNTNARGDVIDSTNKTVSPRSKQVNRQYKKQTNGLVQDLPVMNSQKAATIVAQQYVGQSEITGLDDTDVDKLLITPTEVTVDEATEAADPAITAESIAATGGLAGAIARAREVKQEPIKTQHEEERSVTGVKKI